MKNAPPKYHQISSVIIEQIRNGMLPLGARIPSENELIKTYSISNTTSRKILQELNTLGYVKKIRGKGTFVENISIDRAPSKIMGFTKNIQQSGLIPSTKLLESIIINENIQKIIVQNKYTLEKPCLKIKRIRFANNIPIMIEERFISLQICKGIEKMNLEKSLYDIYENEFQLKITRIDQTLSSIIIDKELSGLFESATKIPGFIFEGVSFDNHGRIVEIEKSIYRGDKYKFIIEANS